MKYYEYSGCNKKTEGILSFGGIKNYYCLEHLKKVKRRLIGI